MRTATALIIAAVALAGMVLLLMREDTVEEGADVMD
jgi:hypothetical protein